MLSKNLEEGILVNFQKTLAHKKRTPEGGPFY